MQDSIYHSIPQLFFREYVKVITDKNKTAPEILSTYRERSKITKKFVTVTVQQFTDRSRPLYGVSP